MGDGKEEATAQLFDPLLPQCKPKAERLSLRFYCVKTSISATFHRVCSLPTALAAFRGEWNGRVDEARCEQKRNDAARHPRISPSSCFVVAHAETLAKLNVFMAGDDSS
jgi:hypothetical protein